MRMMYNPLIDQPSANCLWFSEGCRKISVSRILSDAKLLLLRAAAAGLIIIPGSPIHLSYINLRENRSAPYQKVQKDTYTMTVLRARTVVQGAMISSSEPVRLSEGLEHWDKLQERRSKLEHFHLFLLLRARLMTIGRIFNLFDIWNPDNPIQDLIRTIYCLKTSLARNDISAGFVKDKYQQGDRDPRVSGDLQYLIPIQR